MMNKKGQIEGMLFIIVTCMIIVFLGFIMVTGSAVTNYVFDIVTPELSSLGVIGDANLTDVASYTIEPLNDIVQQFTWVTGVLYVVMLIATFGIASSVNVAPNRWLIGFYLMLVVMLVLCCILISNIYEEFYTGTDDLATRLQEHTILSWMILYSPMVFSIIGFVAGIILFSGMNEGEFG